MEDYLGNKVTTNSCEIINGINTFTLSLLKYGNEAGIVFESIKSEPENVIMNTHCAVISLYIGDNEKALEYLSRAKKNLDKTTEREKLYFKAILNWAEGKMKDAIDTHMLIAKKYPKDLCSAYICYNHLIYLGDVKSLLTLSETIFSSNKDDVYVQSMMCFALEQNDKFEEAEKIGKEATLNAPNEDNPWAHHSVCHVYDSLGRLEEGISWMENYSHHWEVCNSFLKHHNWWHLALLYLEKGGIIEENDKRVLDIINDHIWINDKNWRSDSTVLAGAIGLFWRIDLKGTMNISDKWEDVRDYVKPIVKNTITQPYLDLHYLYACLRNKDFERADEMIENMKEYANTIDDYLKPNWKNVVLPIAEGLKSYANNDYNSAYQQFKYAFPQMIKIGGSHAQRRVFENTYLDILYKTNHYDEELHLLNENLKRVNNNFVYTYEKRLYECYMKQKNDKVFNTKFYRNYILNKVT